MKTMLNVVMLTAISVVLIPSIASAQESRASVTGLVLDSSGATGSESADRRQEYCDQRFPRPPRRTRPETTRSNI